jgi:hypothetical protein
MQRYHSRENCVVLIATAEPSFYLGLELNQGAMEGLVGKQGTGGGAGTPIAPFSYQVQL